MRAWRTLLISLALSVVQAHAVEAPLADLARDRKGQVWAIRRDQADGLLLLEGQDWVASPVAALHEAVPLRLLALRDSSIACLWKLPGPDYALSRHRGKEPPTIAHFPGTLKEPQLIELSTGAVLITERGPAVVEIPRTGEARVTKIADDFFRPLAEPVEPANQTYAPVCALEDAQHKVWLWSYALRPEPKVWHLLNFLSYAAGQVTGRPVPELDPAAPISDMAILDEHHFAFGKIGEGIYTLETTTLELKLTTKPLAKRNASDNVEQIEQIFRDARELFAITCPRPVEIETMPSEVPGIVLIAQKTFHNQSRPTGRLLHYKEGAWEEVLPALDRAPAFGWRDRPHLATPAGLLLGSHRKAPWLAFGPSKKPAIHLGWETDFPLRDAVRLVTVDATHLCALSSQGEVAITPIEPARDPSQSGFRAFNIFRQPLADSKGFLWGFPGAGSFSKWNGETWEKAAMPPGTAQEYRNPEWWGDDCDQGWLISSDDKTAVCDFTTGEWKAYPSRDAAFQAQKPRAPRILSADQPVFSPALTKEGLIAYLAPKDGLHFYNGTAWKVWPVREIGGEETRLAGPPFFNEQQHVCLPLGSSVHELSAAGEQWETRPRTEQDPKTVWRQPEAIGSLPEGCTVSNVKSAQVDALGTTWITSQEGRLYKAVPGRTVPALPETAANPFRYGHVPQHIVVDLKGGAMILPINEGNPYDYLYLAPTLPLPDTAATLLEVRGDEARVKLSSGVAVAGVPPPEVWYSWQLDGGRWQPVQQKQELNLPGLTSGAHRLQIRAYNAELGGDWTPAIVEFKVDLGDPEVMKARAAELGAPSREKREAAAQYLRAQGAAALPALKEAQKNGAIEAQWWVEKVLGQIEGDLKSKPAAP